MATTARTYDDLLALVKRILDLGEDPAELIEDGDLVWDALTDIGEKPTKALVEAVRDNLVAQGY
jgi:hypothetical protein